MIPDLSVLWVIFFVLILSVVLDRLLFRPLLGVMTQREHAIRSARDLADAAAAKAQGAMRELEARTVEARGEVYRQMDEMRRQASEHRTQLVEQTRREAAAATGEATARVRGQTDAARARLEREADDLAGAIAERVLGRRVS